MQRLTLANLRHLGSLVVRGRNPVATVYDSIGPDPFIALAPGWLNLGLWEGTGEEDEAPVAPVRLVETLAGELPPGGRVLDVGNGLGAQDPVIARVVDPDRLVAINVTESHLRAGRERLRSADARAVLGDAVRLPFAEASFDGVISVEAAFHFASRDRFFREAHRVLRPGGVLSFSDVTTERLPRRPREALAALVNLRAWGLRLSAAVSAKDLGTAVRRAGFADLRIELVGERVFDQAFRVLRRRLRAERSATGPVRAAASALLSQMEVLWRDRLVEYALVRATRR
ncbi:MAG TPA: class I SAM-dependent methyltransferase [Actinomycetota bacterium]|nr:class I SAM-dependent methyltransferase [Actinomycetota bacterium]